MKVAAKPVSAMREFLNGEAAGGIILIVAAALAMLVANSPFAEHYFHWLHVDIGPLSTLHWVNDGLMALFFLLVGLEIKREVILGELSTRPQRILPGFAALGGMAVPALVYVFFNYTQAENLRGWAIPSATDIAFALGILSLLGKRVPVSLKIFLTALAIIDDLGAVLIIAAFYTQNLAFDMLAGAAVVVAALYYCNRKSIGLLPLYLALGLVLWVLVLKSGIHATLAGVVLAFFVPLNLKVPSVHGHSPLQTLEHGLHKWVAFLILPLFSFANAGVSFAGMSWGALAEPVPLGIMLGLFLGKQVGVFASAALAIRLKWAEMPEGVNWLQLYGLSVLCGIGFTMSLFIGFLAFPTHPEMVNAVKLGVFAGSVLSALLGFIVLWLAGRR